MGNAYRLTWGEMGAFRRDQPVTVRRLTERLGGVAHVKMLNMNVCLISDPDAIRVLMVKQAGRVHRDPFTTRVFRRILGQGLFIAEDEAWRRQRKLLQPVFHAAIIHEFTEIFAAYAHEMVDGWRPGDTLRLDREFMALALRVITRTMFSADIGNATERIGVLMATIIGEGEAQLRQPIPLPAWLPTPGHRRQARALGEVHALLTEIIRKRRAQIDAGDEPGSDLLALLLLARDENDQPMSDREIRDECMTIFFAGHETTAVAMTWTWFLLLTHSDALAALRAEVDGVLGGAPVTFGALKQMPRVEATVKEALRLYPPATGFGRTPTEPFVLGDRTVQPGDLLLVSLYALHRRADLFPDPDTFRPERFVNDAPPRYAYLPFSAGPRTCIGNGFALLEMQAVLATLVQRVDLSLAPGQAVVPVTQITLRPRDGVTVRVEGVRLKSPQPLRRLQPLSAPPAAKCSRSGAASPSSTARAAGGAVRGDR